MPPVVVFVCYILAVARVTTLITHDEITRVPREWLIGTFNPNSRTHRVLAYLLGDVNDDGNGCPWCMSVWVSAAMTPLLWWALHPTAAQMIVAGLAASYVTGATASHGRS